MKDEVWSDPKLDLTEDANAFLEQHVKHDDVVLEFGGGASSMWWAKRALYTYTIKASPEDAPRLIERMQQHPELMAKWTMLFAPCDWQARSSQPRAWWKKRTKHLSQHQGTRLETSYAHIPVHLDPTIIVIAGSVRAQTIRTVAEYSRRAAQLRTIVIDNMELMEPYCKGKFAGFTREDFHEKDPENIPPEQEGVWLTTAFTRQTDPRALRYSHSFMTTDTEIAKLRVQVARFRSSASWKLTAPLRAFMRLVRRK